MAVTRKRKTPTKNRSVPMIIEQDNEPQEFLFKPKSLTPLISIATGMISFLSGVITASVWVTRNVATVPYIEQQIVEINKKIEGASLTALKEAQVYSDTASAKQRASFSQDLNDTRLKVESIQGDMKAAAVKQDLMLDALRAIQNQAASNAAASISGKSSR